MKKIFLFLLLILLYCNAQYANLEKYWIYRERLKDFMVGSGDKGCSIPFNRDPGDSSSNNEPYIATGDAPWMIGYWIGTLALEYDMLSHNGYNVSQTKQDLYYAIEAINRLDYEAEISWGCTAVSKPDFLVHRSGTQKRINYT